VTGRDYFVLLEITYFFEQLRDFILRVSGNDPKSLRWAALEMNAIGFMDFCRVLHFWGGSA